MTDNPTPEQQLDAAYRERAHLVAWLAAMFPAVIAPAPDVDEPGWQIVYLTFGGWQMSWHISPRDADLFTHVPHVPADDPRAQWDGHTTDQKYARIRSLTAENDAEADRILHERLAALGVQPPAGGPLGVLRARLVAERDRARRSSAASRREDVGLAQSGIAAGLDIAIALLDHLPAQGTAGKPADGMLRDRYAAALRGSVAEWAPFDMVLDRLMAARDDELAQARARVADAEAKQHRVRDEVDGNLTPHAFRIQGILDCPWPDEGSSLAEAVAERDRYRAAWRSARRRAADNEEEARRQHHDCQTAEALLAQVREFAALTAGSCHVPSAETARDLQRLLDDAHSPEAGRG